LYYYRARYYDPVSKQWLSEDPIGLAGGINLRVYVGGDPINFADPKGLYEDPMLRIASRVAGIPERSQAYYERQAAAQQSTRAYKKCIDDYLISSYGEFFGYWLVDTLVPNFSVYSYFDGDTFWRATSTSVSAVAVKGGIVAGTSYAGSALTAAGYGAAGAIATGAGTIGAIGMLGAGSMLTAFATTAHRGAQLYCTCPN